MPKKLVELPQAAMDHMSQTAKGQLANRAPHLVTDHNPAPTGEPRTISFDELPSDPQSPGGAPIPDGYDGFIWSNVFQLNGTNYAHEQNGAIYGLGYKLVGSGTNVAYNGFGSTGDVSTTGADFDLLSAFMGSAWEDDQQVVINGYDNGVLVATQTLVLDVGRTLVTFNSQFDSIDRFTFAAVDNTGIPHVVGWPGDHVALDDLTVAFETGANNADWLLA